MCNDKIVINNNITFEENKIIGSKELLSTYDSEREITLPNYYFEKNVAILTTKKVFRFKNCTILGELLLPDNVSKICFENCTIASVKSNIRMKGGRIIEFIIKDTTIKGKFYLNNKENSNRVAIDKLKIDSVIFNEKFKLINCDIESFEICNSDFQKDIHITDCKLSLGKLQSKILFYGINFQKNSYFSGTEFGSETKFSKVTFSENVDFQETIFNKGLNLNKTTIKKGINFAGCNGLETKQSIEKTPKETFRIIKNNFLKLQNKIEANKFYSLELKKQKKMLWKDFWSWKGKFQDRLVYLSHRISSNYGMSWLLALAGIWLIGLLTSIFINMNIFSYLFDCPKDISEYVFFEGIKYSYLLNRSTEFFNSHPVIYVLNKIILGYWYYQFVMAVRKDTKR